MEALGKVWAVVASHWVVALLGLLAVVVAVVLVVWWRRKKQPVASSLGASQPMKRGALVEVRQRFLSGLPWLNRTAVLDLPTAVVLGPAKSGKTTLIGLDVDWQRQARQFLPSYTDNPLLQIFLGPGTVVQEVSSQLLEDDTPQARSALRQLWRASFKRRNKSLSVIVLDVHWLAETPPDEVRRAAQLLRGKLNLISEVCKGAVETRLCLTHLDTLEGYTDFAQLLRQHGVPLSFELPQRGDEAKLASLLDAQQQYLALGLTSLELKAFERLEGFYAQGNKAFAALSRFVAALQEGGTLSFQPKLTRLYLSSPKPDTREEGVLTIPTEAASAQQLRKRYLRTHLGRALVIAAVLGLPVLAAYANFYIQLQRAQDSMKKLEDTLGQLHKKHLDKTGSVVTEQVMMASEAMQALWRANRYWPGLRYSFTDAWAGLRRRMATAIRQSHIQPELEFCHENPQDCPPERAVYLLAVLHGSRTDELGKYVLHHIHPKQHWEWAQELTGEAEEDPGTPPPAPGPSPEALATASSSWVEAVYLDEQLVENYIYSSDVPWVPTTPAEKAWASWPFPHELTLAAQLEPWSDHFKNLQDVLRAQPPHMGQLEALATDRAQLEAQLLESELFSGLPEVLDRLDASKLDINSSHFRGIRSTVEALEWVQEHRETLLGVLRMEQQALQGFKSLEKMTPAELLTRGGLWIPAAGEETILKVQVEQDAFEFRPPELSRELMHSLIAYYETTGRMPFQGVPANASASTSDIPAGAGVGADGGEDGDAADGSDVLAVMDRVPFETYIKPLVDEFTQRLKNAQLTPEQAAQRQDYVRKKMDRFAQGYREGLFVTTRAYRFTATPRTLGEELGKLTQPSSGLVDMLRDVANRANLEPLEGPYYEPLRNAVAPFKPVITLMTQDKTGTYAALAPYQTLLAQLHDDVTGAAKKDAKAAKGAKDKAAKDAKDKDAKPAEGEAAEGGAEADGPAALSELLSPLGQTALPMLLDEEGSYLRKVDAWLDTQGLIGELREPFRQPFLVARDLGRAEIENVLATQWGLTDARMLNPMLKRYPFAADAQEEVDPADLEALRRKDGAFWQFVERVVTPVCVERGSDWALKGPLRNKLRLPSKMLPTLSKLSKLSRMLWDEAGKPRPLMLQVLPLPLPAPPEPNTFVTMASLKCGKATAFGYNQSPSWQDFPLNWWEQQTASIVLELRAPKKESLQYRSMEKARSSWSCFRLMEAATATADQHRLWRLTGRGAEANKKVLDISFGMKGEPWVPFREVPR